MFQASLIPTTTWSQQHGTKSKTPPLNGSGNTWKGAKLACPFTRLENLNIEMDHLTNYCGSTSSSKNLMHHCQEPHTEPSWERDGSYGTVTAKQSVLPQQPFAMQSKAQSHNYGGADTGSHRRMRTQLLTMTFPDEPWQPPQLMCADG